MRIRKKYPFFVYKLPKGISSGQIKQKKTSCPRCDGFRAVCTLDFHPTLSASARDLRRGHNLNSHCAALSIGQACTSCLCLGYLLLTPCPPGCSPGTLASSMSSVIFTLLPPHLEEGNNFLWSQNCPIPSFIGSDSGS